MPCVTTKRSSGPTSEHDRVRRHRGEGAVPALHLAGECDRLLGAVEAQGLRREARVGHRPRPERDRIADLAAGPGAAGFAVGGVEVDWLDASAAYRPIKRGATPGRQRALPGASRVRTGIRARARGPGSSAGRSARSPAAPRTMP